MKKIHLFTNIYPLYRKSLWDELMKSTLLEFHFYFSKKTKQQIQTVNVETSYNKEAQSRFNFIKNYYIGSYLFWQSSILYHVIRVPKGTFIFLGEMTVLSTWIATIIFKIRGIKVIFWGHGLYGSENRLKRLFRIQFLQLADHNLVYEKRAKKLLIQQGFNESKVSVIYNSINYKQQKKLFQKHQITPPTKIFYNPYPTLLFIGRLTPQKKVDQLIKAIQLLEKENNKFNVLLVGAGPEKERLEHLAQPLINQGQCIFYGASYNETELSKLIYASDLTVSPGNIGLTGIHSLSYGTPVSSHSNFNNQMPEVEAIIEGKNGFLFEEGNIESLAKGILDWFKNNPNLDREKIRSVVDKYYNPNFQIKVIKEAIE